MTLDNASTARQLQAVQGNKMSVGFDNEIRLTLDAFANPMARLGAGTPNMLEATEYPLTRLTKNYTLMNSLYRSHWLVRRIIDIIPEDMVKNWYSLESQLEPGALDRISKLERKKQVKAKILEALKWGGLYGGAAAIMMIKGHEDYLDQPLDLDTVFPGSFMGLMILDRWSGISPGPGVVDDINDPDFGLPETYQVTNNASRQTFDVHHSRVLRFIGRDLPFWEKQAEVGWGASEIEHVFDEIKKRDNTSWNMAQLVFLANLRVLKMDGLEEILSSTSAVQQQRLYNTVQNQNWLMNNMGLQVMGKDDDFDTKSYAFSGLSEVYECFMADVSGAAEIPITKLFGRSPGGLNATGEGDLQNYYDSIGAKQESKLRPVFDKLLPIMFMSELGAVPDDFKFNFNPMEELNDSEKADLSSKMTTTVLAAFNAGIISPQTTLKELQQMSGTTGVWTNITDEDVAKADAEVQPQGMVGMMPPGMGGDNPFGDGNPPGTPKLPAGNESGPPSLPPGTPAGASSSPVGGQEDSTNPLLALDNALDLLSNALINKMGLSATMATTDAQPASSGNHWVTIKRDEDSENVRRILLDAQGNIIGGDVPKTAQGKPIGATSTWTSITKPNAPGTGAESKPATEPKSEPKPTPEPIPEPEKPVIADAPIYKTTKEAQAWAHDNLGIESTDYTNIHVTAANAINKAVHNFKQRFTQVQGTKWLSTSQQLFRAKYEDDLVKRTDRLVQMGYDEEKAAKYAASAVKKKKVPGRAYAFSTGPGWGKYEGIALSEKFVKTAKAYEEMRTQISRDIASGFHPVGTEDPSSVVTHEMGHQLKNLLDAHHKNTFIEQAYSQFKQEAGDRMRETGDPGAKVYGDLLSRYGATNRDEFFAEAIMEYLHNPNPRKYAMMIGQGAEKALKEL
jgi:phage-related protein (TIGR01555 family)